MTATANQAHIARLAFVIRTPAANGHGSIYRNGRPLMPSAFVPRIGDLVDIPESGTMGRVYDVVWLWPAYGSATWPAGSALAQHGPIVEVLVDEAQGPYADEAGRYADEPDEADQ